MNTCPVCETILPPPFLERRAIPVHQNLVMRSADAARAASRGDLTLAHCPCCDFVTNTSFRHDLVEYGEHYDNNQVCSPTFEGYVDSLVDDLGTQVSRNQQVIEVGCGNGYFLRKLVTRTGCSGLGFDPSYRGPEQGAGGRLRFVTDYYGPRYAEVAADVVVSRHVIEHVGDPITLLRSVRSALRLSPGALVAFETPAVEWILDGGVYHDFFYEHCSYFSHRSLPVAFALAGFDAVSTKRVFGDQYLWVEAIVTDASERPVGNGSLGPDISAYVATEAKRLAAAGQMIDELATAGGVAVWGAGAKGVTFLNLIDPDGTKIGCAVDINPNKQGSFVPGTGHPIVDVARLAEVGIRHVVLMNPNYLEEARAMVRVLDIDIDFHKDHAQ